MRLRREGQGEAILRYSRSGIINDTKRNRKLVRSARRDLGLRQAELAGAANVGTRFIVDLEAGEASAQLGKTLGMLAALGCRVSIDPPASAKVKRR